MKAFLRAIERHFRKRWELVTAESGSAAFEHLRENPASFDAVVCDLLMPEMDGAEFAKRACELEPALRGRIIFLTGGDLTTEGPQAAVTEFDNLVLHKPIDLDYLAELIEEGVPHPEGGGEPGDDARGRQ